MVLLRSLMVLLQCRKISIVSGSDHTGQVWPKQIAGHWTADRDIIWIWQSVGIIALLHHAQDFPTRRLVGTLPQISDLPLLSRLHILSGPRMNRATSALARHTVSGRGDVNARSELISPAVTLPAFELIAARGKGCHGKSSGATLHNTYTHCVAILYNV